MAQVTSDSMQEVLKRAYGARTSPTSAPTSASAPGTSLPLSTQEQEEAVPHIDTGASLEELKRLAEAAEGDQADAITNLVHALEAFDRAVEK